MISQSDFVQAALMTFSLLCIWLVGRPGRWQRWGFVCGVLSEPFWIWNCLLVGAIHHWSVGRKEGP